MRQRLGGARRACPRPRPPRSPRGRAPPAPRPAADARRRSGRAAAPRCASCASAESDPSHTCCERREVARPASRPSASPRGRRRAPPPRPPAGASAVSSARCASSRSWSACGLRDRRARASASAASAARQVAPGRARPPRDVGAGVAVEQRAVAARIDQPAIVVLAVQFDQRRRQLAQQRRADRLVVDEGLAMPPSALSWRRRISGSPGSTSISASSSASRSAGGSAANSKLAVDARLVLAARAPAALSARLPSTRPERIEQDRLARAGLARQHAQPAARRSRSSASIRTMLRMESAVSMGGARSSGTKAARHASPSAR